MSAFACSFRQGSAQVAFRRAEPQPVLRPPSAFSDTHGDPPRDPKPAAITGIPRSGYSNGHGQRQAVVSAKRELHGGLAYGSGGPGMAGGTSFRAGGAITFHSTRHVKHVGAGAAGWRKGVAGATSFRGAGTTSFHGAPGTSSAAGGSIGAPRTAVMTAATSGSSSSSSGSASGHTSFRGAGSAAFRARAPARPLPVSDERPAVQAGAGGQASFRGTGSAAFNPQLQGQGQGQAGGAKQSNIQQTLDKLRELGLAGVVAYGLLNTVYYTATFLFVWLYVAKVPQGAGAASAAKSFLAVFGTVWAGSQVTKLARAAGAVVLAPIVDRALDVVQSTLKLKSKQQAFGCILVVCVGIALAVFGGVVAAWA